MGFVAHVQDGYFRFVAMFTWPPQEDKVARERFRQLLDRVDQLDELLAGTGILPGQSQAYILTGARTVLIIGYTNSGPGLYSFCSSIMFNTAIQANIYHAVEANELKKVFDTM